MRYPEQNLGGSWQHEHIFTLGWNEFTGVNPPIWMVSDTGWILEDPDKKCVNTGRTELWVQAQTCDTGSVRCQSYWLCHHVAFKRFKSTLLGTLYKILGSLHCSWHRLHKMLATFLWDYASCWHDCIVQLLLIFQVSFNGVNLSFYHIPKVFYWIQIQWMGRLPKNIEISVMFMETSFALWYGVLSCWK